MLEMQRNAHVLRRWWWLLVVATLAGGIIAFGLTKLLVHQKYQATAIVALAPPPQGPNGLYVTMLSASADAQLVPTQDTATVAARGIRGISPTTLAENIESDASVEGQLLYVHVRWPVKSQAPLLADAVARAFIDTERGRLLRRAALIHQQLLAQERHFDALQRTVGGSGQASTWLRSQYAEDAARIYQEDADARIQATTQVASLQLVQPADKLVAVGPKPALNGAIGAVVALLLALVFAFMSTETYGDEADERPRPILSSVAE